MKKKILIVDDEIEDLKTMQIILEKVGYNTVAVRNCEKALDLLKTNKFNLLLVDILMPTLSGYDLLRLLREKAHNNIKMIFVSIVPKNELDLSDIDGFIQKPFSPEIFIDKIKKVIKK